MNCVCNFCFIIANRKKIKYGINFKSHGLAHCIKVATAVEQPDSQSNCLIEQLRILLRSRCNEYVINGLTHDEITELIHEIA